MYLGESRRAVCFRRSETAAAERKAFVASVASAFEDIFGGDEELPSSSSLLVQVKSEEWGGEFVDLMSDASIPDRSILRVVVGKCKVSLKFSCSEVKTKLFRGLGVCAELLTNNLLKLVWCS